MLSDKAYLAQLDGKIESSKLRAQHWIVSAVTGAVCKRAMQVVDGNLPKRADGTYKWVEMGDQDKIDHALIVANNHIEIMEECVDRKIELVEKMNKVAK